MKGVWHVSKYFPVLFYLCISFTYDRVFVMISKRHWRKLIRHFWMRF